VFESPNAFVGRWAAPESGKQEGQKLKKSFRGGGAHCERQTQDAEGVEFEALRVETPKGCREWGRGIPLPSRLGEFCGIERRKLPQRGPGQSPGEKRFLPRDAMHPRY